MDTEDKYVHNALNYKALFWMLIVLLDTILFLYPYNDWVLYK